MNNNIVSENKSLRDRISGLEEDMFEIQEQLKREAAKGKNVEEEMGLRQAKAENRNLIERVEFLQRRERELEEALGER